MEISNSNNTPEPKRDKQLPKTNAQLSSLSFLEDRPLALLDSDHFHLEMLLARSPKKTSAELVEDFQEGMHLTPLQQEGLASAFISTFRSAESSRWEKDFKKLSAAYSKVIDALHQYQQQEALKTLSEYTLQIVEEMSESMAVKSNGVAG